MRDLIEIEMPVLWAVMQKLQHFECVNQFRSCSKHACTDTHRPTKITFMQIGSSNDGLGNDHPIHYYILDCGIVSLERIQIKKKPYTVIQILTRTFVSFQLCCFSNSFGSIE